MKLWSLVVVLALMAAVCAGAAILVAWYVRVDPFLVANAAMFAVMAVYVARRAARPAPAVGPSCRRCGALGPPDFGFCLRCGHIPRRLRGTA